MYLSQSTDVTIDIGPFKSLATDETNDAIDVTDIEVSLFQLGTKTDLTITASGGPNDMVTHNFAGIYSLELTGSNVSTIGPLSVVAITAGFQVVRHEFFVIDQPAYDEITSGGIAQRVWSFIDGPLATPSPISVASSTNTTLTLDTAPDTYPDDYFNGMAITSGKSDDSDKQAAIVVDFDGTSNVVTIDREWITNPDGSYNASFWPSTFNPSGSVDANLVSVNGTTETADVIEELFVTDAETYRNAMADKFLRRNWNSVATPADRSVLNALRFLRNHRSIVAGVLNVTEEDDTTVAWSANLTTSASAEPITDIDPT